MSNRRFASTILILPLLMACFALTGCGQKPTREVRFGNLADGQEIVSPFTVQMEALGLVVEPASEGVRDGHGHFHILINVPTVKAPSPIPFDEQHLHFGAGQTEAVLDLPEGEHLLTLQFATGDHVPYDPPIAQTVRVRVVQRGE
jgi:hypothetical protein